MMRWKGMLIVGSLTAVGGYVLGQVMLPASARGQGQQVEREIAEMQARLDDVEHASRQQRRAVEVAVSSVHRDARDADSGAQEQGDAEQPREPAPTDVEVAQEERQLLSDLTRAAHEETADRSWAPLAERSVREALDAASRGDVPGVELREIRCGSTKCALEAALPGNGDEPPQSAVRRLLMQPEFREFPAMAFGLEDTADGGVTLRVVVSRAGHELEGVSRPDNPDGEGEN